MRRPSRSFLSILVMTLVAMLSAGSASLAQQDDDNKRGDHRVTAVPGHAEELGHAVDQFRPRVSIGRFWCHRFGGRHAWYFLMDEI